MEIPVFPVFKEVDLADQGIIEEFLSRYPLEASEYTFTNIFAFRMAYNFRISVLRDNLLILKDKGPVSLFCPLGNSHMSEVMNEIVEYVKDDDVEYFLERIPENFIHTYIKGDKRFIAEEDRDNFDYLYDAKELIDLKGPRFHDKRNKVNKFRNLYKYEYMSLTSAMVDECLEFEDYWCETRECGKYPGLEKEKCAILEMLNNFDSLNVIGGVIRIENKIAALTLGEKILPDTFVIHIEKANSEISGLYQVINQEFLMHEAGDCRYVNREQDLGVPGLRKSKISYNPVKYIKKFRVKKNIA